MDSIPISFLKQLKTISALQVLVALLSKAREGNEVEYSKAKLIADSGISRNTVKKAVEELVSLKFVDVVSIGNGKDITSYRINIGSPIIDPPQKLVSPITVPSPIIDKSVVWEKATAARKSKDSQESNNINIVNNIDFNNINILQEDINSLMVVNSNIYMTDKELGVLANRVVREVFLPMSTGDKPKFWFPQQMKLMKDLLVEWRTEQIVAAIRYWTTVNPPPKGISSLRFLQFKRKNTSHIMIALDYYKQQYLANASEINREKIDDKLAEIALREAEEKAAAEAEKAKVDAMSNDDFVKNLLGGIGL